MDKEIVELINEFSKAKTRYDILVNYLINNAELSYSKDKLRIEDCSNIIKALEPEKYNNKLNMLLNEKETE